MSKYRKIFHHVSTKDVREKHLGILNAKELKEKNIIKEKEYVTSIMDDVKYSWRDGEDKGKDIREAMTTANVYQKLGDTSEDGELETQVIDTSLEASFEDGPDNSLANYMFSAVDIKDSGSGLYANGGFNIGKHLAFSANTNSDGSAYQPTSSRWAMLAPIDARNMDSITITAIRGNDQNGGELPDYTDEDLRIQWYTTNTALWNQGEGGRWQSLKYDNDGNLHNDVEDIIIPIISQGEGSSQALEFPSLRDWTIPIPEWCRRENVRFMLYQKKHSGQPYDHYGITQIKYSARTPTNAFVALDKPEASSFVRLGSNIGSPRKRKKKLEDQLKASKKYTDTVLGKDFPGGSATIDEPPASPIGYQQVADTHKETLSQKIKKALAKNDAEVELVDPLNPIQPRTPGGSVVDTIKGLTKIEKIKDKTVSDITPEEKSEIINEIGEEKYTTIETVSKTPSFKGMNIRDIQKVQSEVGKVEIQNLAEKNPKEITQQVHDIGQKSPEFANAMQSVGTAGKVYANYLLGNLPDKIDNDYLGDGFVNRAFRDAKLLSNGGVSVGDAVIGSSSKVRYDPITNKIIVPFNYDFDTNEQAIMKEPDKYDARKLIPAIGMTAAWIVGGKYGIDSVPIPGAGYATWLSKTLGIGGKHTPGEISITPAELRKINPDLHMMLVGTDVLPLTKYQDPYSKENFKNNLPSWFTFSHRDEYGRIWGTNHSGGYGVLSPSEERGERGSTESGYGSPGYDWETNSGGATWSFALDKDVSKLDPSFPPEEEPAPGKKWELVPDGTDVEFKMTKVNQETTRNQVADLINKQYPLGDDSWKETLPYWVNKNSVVRDPKTGIVTGTNISDVSGNGRGVLIPVGPEYWNQKITVNYTDSKGNPKSYSYVLGDLRDTQGGSKRDSKWILKSFSRMSDVEKESYYSKDPLPHPTSKASSVWTQVDVEDVPANTVNSLFDKNSTLEEENEIIDNLESEELDETKLESIFDSDIGIVSRALESSRDPAYSYQNGLNVVYGYDLDNAWNQSYYRDGRARRLTWMPRTDGYWSGDLSHYSLSPNQYLEKTTRKLYNSDQILYSYKIKTADIREWWPKKEIEDILGYELFFRSKDKQPGDNEYEDSVDHMYGDIYYAEEGNFLEFRPGWDTSKNYYYHNGEAYDINDGGFNARYARWDEVRGSNGGGIWDNYLRRFQTYVGQGKGDLYSGWDWNTSDGKSAWGWVPPGTMDPEEYGGGPSRFTSDPAVREINARFWEVYNYHQSKSIDISNERTAKRAPVRADYFAKKEMIKPLQTNLNLEKKEIQKDENVFRVLSEYEMKKIHGELQYEPCYYVNCKKITRPDGTSYRVGPVKKQKYDKFVIGRNGEKHVVWKKGDPVYSFPYGKGRMWKYDTGKYEEYDHSELYNEYYHNIELWKEENYTPWYERYNNLAQYAANIELEYKQKLYDIDIEKLISLAKLSREIRDIMDNDPLSESYKLIHGEPPEEEPPEEEPPEEDPGEKDPWRKWDDYDPNEPVSEADEQWLNTWETRTKWLGILEKLNISLDFARMAIQYARGDNTPWKKFDPVLERQTLALVEEKFKKNPNAKDLDIDYTDWGFPPKSTGTLSLGSFHVWKHDKQGNPLPPGQYRIEDNFDVSKIFRSVGFWGDLPFGLGKDLQKYADRIVRIAHQRRGYDPKDLGERNGIPIDIIIGIKSVHRKRREALSVDEPIVRTGTSSTKSKKRKKKNYVKSKSVGTVKETSFDKVKKVSRSYDYNRSKILEELVIVKPKQKPNVKVVQEKSSDWREEIVIKEVSDWTPMPVTSRPTMSTSQTFAHISGTVATFNALGGPDGHPDTVTVDWGYGEIEQVSPPTISEIPIQGHASPIDPWKMARKNNKKSAKQINKQLDASEKVAGKAGADALMKGRVTQNIEDLPHDEKVKEVERRKKEIEKWENEVKNYSENVYTPLVQERDDKIMADVKSRHTRAKTRAKAWGWKGKLEFETMTHGFQIVGKYSPKGSTQRLIVIEKESKFYKLDDPNSGGFTIYNVRPYRFEDGTYAEITRSDFNTPREIPILGVSKYHKHDPEAKSTFGFRGITMNGHKYETFNLMEKPPYPEYKGPEEPWFMKKNMAPDPELVKNGYPYPSWGPPGEYAKQFISTMNTWFNTILRVGGANFPAQLALQLANADLTPITKSPGHIVDKVIKNNIMKNLEKGHTKSDKIGSNSYWDPKTGRGAIRYDVYGEFDAVTATVSASLGQYSIERTKDGIRITDKYDISKGFTAPGGAAKFDRLAKFVTKSIGYPKDVQAVGESLTAIAATKAAQLGFTMVNADPDENTGIHEKLKPVALGEEEWNSRTDKQSKGLDGKPLAPTIATPKGFNIPIDFTIPWSQVSLELRNKLGGNQFNTGPKRPPRSKGRLDAYGGVDKLHDKKKKKKNFHSRFINKK